MFREGRGAGIGQVLWDIGHIIGGIGRMALRIDHISCEISHIAGGIGRMALRIGHMWK
ncbi:hypothetical protein PGH26_02355 [Sporosarcina jeotgali]|uniref:Uncharacterized protein n=1 Tax=Sporosarcina jeotgali TaxID=3020056 RepID=A0ABZ0KWL5_9BACL|nr:hypothetical protein [Sporosarcina sp. B2O-1]WOV84790.1 hypothetical protein PGH26_02355 [Sporosarcina sp. B2O-1]